jgi:uncharacterized phage protein gp47/JayE
MYENMTFEFIMQRMLSMVPDTMDKREGSIIYTAIAPAVVEYVNMYIQADFIRRMSSVLTATGEYLDDKVEEKGVYRIQPTKAIVKGVFNIDVPVGSRFSGDELNYVVIEKVSDGAFLMECETAGTAGNDYLGELSSIEYIQGLESAEIVSIEIPAIDLEEDEDLRQRYFDTIKGDARDGNVAQYLKWILEYPDVGRGKVFPCWEGKNTVKLSVLNAENGVASETLVEEFQNYMDPNSEGLGNGVAPVGACVTVTTATKVHIDIDVEIYLNSGYTSAEGVKEAVEAMLNKLAYTSSVLNFYEVAFVISSCASVDRISTLTVNGGNTDILLRSEEIPVLGSFNVQVVS